MSERLMVSPIGGKLEPVHIEENFKDLHPPLSQTQSMVESARCLYCYDAPCIKACPTSIDIPQFIHQLRTKNIQGSAKTILASNIMGGTCARVCPTESLCEGACVKNRTGEDPIQIGQLQRFAVDHFFNSGAPAPFTRKPSTGKTAAVIGAGPAGLAFAHRMAREGHDVHVFEARPKSGGLNEYGLAAYKMADDFARREVEFLLEIGGITLNQEMILGENLDLQTLRRDYDGVFIGIGLGGVNDLGIPGENLDGVRDAIDFIEELRQTKIKSMMETGDDVLVIGGGNTAIDAAVQAKRLGAERVTLAYRRGSMQMPATEWEQDLAKTNDVQVLCWAKPLEISPSSEKGKLEVLFETTRLKEGSLVGTGETFTLKSSLVLKAIGQILEDNLLDGIDLNQRKISIDSSYRTSLEGVYAGGDCTATGEDLTVQAVYDGRTAAETMIADLKEGD